MGRTWPLSKTVISAELASPVPCLLRVRGGGKTKEILMNIAVKVLITNRILWYSKQANNKGTGVAWYEFDGWCLNFSINIYFLLGVFGLERSPFDHLQMMADNIRRVNLGFFFFFIIFSIYSPSPDSLISTIHDGHLLNLQPDPHSPDGPATLSLLTQEQNRIVVSCRPRRRVVKWGGGE